MGLLLMSFTGWRKFLERSSVNMKPIECKNIILTGDLAFRVGRNFTRLESPMYRPEDIFGSDKQGWPGDWEGRTLLALCLNESLSGRKAAYLDLIIEELDSQWNRLGYLKEICPAGVINEQQLSGHNWLLRAILELYLAKKEDRFRVMAKRIVENLYLPLQGRFASYPVAPGSRILDGGAVGQIAGEDGQGWLLSTDIGCAFISFDALAQYYQIFGGEELQKLLDEMFEVFSSIDFVASSVQTHATLSALRGVLRYYQASKKEVLLAFAEKLFDLYLTNGITENYANYNWFGRPYWTEPCAIVDSYMVAMNLFRFTKKVEYLMIANKIYYNALLASQRHNGGFGCDMCSGTKESDVFLQVKEGLYEAYWCCSMRGAEGLCNAASNAVLLDGDDIYVTNYVSGEFQADKLTVAIKSRYPYENRAIVRIKGIDKSVTLKFYVPDGATDIGIDQNGALQYSHNGSFVTVTVDSDAPVVLHFSTPRVKKELVGSHTDQSGFVEWTGDLIVAQKADGTETFLCDRIYGETDDEVIVSFIHRTV